MTEIDFLISRALAVYNRQYGRTIKTEDCLIVSIPAGVSADRAYEITTPYDSPYFRIRYFIKFGSRDIDGWARLEVSPPYLPGILGDEVYAIHGTVDNYWRREHGYPFNPIAPLDWPMGVIVTELNHPIITENGDFVVAEFA